MTLKKIGLGLLTAMTVIALAACDMDDDDDRVVSTQSTVASSAQTANSTQASAATTTASGTLSLEEVKAIALKDAGFAEADVTLLMIEPDTDNCIPTYDIEFVKDTTEYSYSINANTGDILEKSSELAD